MRLEMNNKNILRLPGDCDFLAYEGENDSDDLIIDVDEIRDGWTYYLDIAGGRGMEPYQILLEPNKLESTLVQTLGINVIGGHGKKALQVSMRKDEMIDKSNILYVEVRSSILAEKGVDDFVPSEFEQFRQLIEQYVLDAEGWADLSGDKAEDAAASASEAEDWAKKAETALSTAEWCWFEDGADGHLYIYKTPHLDSIAVFEITESGRLEVEYQ